MPLPQDLLVRPAQWSMLQEMWTDVVIILLQWIPNLECALFTRELFKPRLLCAPPISDTGGLAFRTEHITTGKQHQLLVVATT